MLSFSPRQNESAISYKKAGCASFEIYIITAKNAYINTFRTKSILATASSSNLPGRPLDSITSHLS